MEKRLHMHIEGRVHGVGYRYFAKKTASQMGLKGYTRNSENDTVEIVVEGEEEKIKEFEIKCWKGPVLSHVTGIKSKWGHATGEYSDFKVDF